MTDRDVGELLDYAEGLHHGPMDGHIKRLAAALRSTREELAKARAERDALAAQVANWERKEIARASCCVDNEREARDLRAQIAKAREALLDAERFLLGETPGMTTPECLRVVRTTLDALTPAADRVDAFDAWYEAAGRPWSGVTDVEATLRARVTQSADEGGGCTCRYVEDSVGISVFVRESCPLHGRKEGA